MMLRWNCDVNGLTTGSIGESIADAQVIRAIPICFASESAEERPQMWAALTSVTMRARVHV
jgi:hypothetical protein